MQIPTAPLINKLLLHLREWIYKMNSGMPSYYMTVDEFAKLVAEVVYECGYFKPGDLNHPEDIEASFTSIATAVAKGASHVVSKVNARKITV